MSKYHNVGCEVHLFVCVQDLTLKEAETIALSILKQVMEEKVSCFVIGSHYKFIRFFLPFLDFLLVGEQACGSGWYCVFLVFECFY